MELIKTHETHLRSEIFKKEHPQPARERTTINQQEKEKGNENQQTKKHAFMGLRKIETGREIYPPLLSTAPYSIKRRSQSNCPDLEQCSTNFLQLRRYYPVSAEWELTICRERL